jgi:hypothetical protein
LDKEHGKGVVKPELSATEAFFLKGVSYAARRYATYIFGGVKREQGWIYGFIEPYQIFILYSILEKDGCQRPCGPEENS